ncbi:MAG: squalene/phytoene synthase family protein [Pseudomonadota bacterium]
MTDAHPETDRSSQSDEPQEAAPDAASTSVDAGGGSDNGATPVDLSSMIQLLGVDADEDLALALPYCAAKDQARIAALFGLAIALRHIPDIVSEPPIGEIRLQWQRETLDGTLDGRPPKGHPIHEALARAGALDGDVRALAERGIDARARFLYAEPFPSVDDLYETLCEAEGWLAAALAGGEALSKDQCAAVMRLGGAYALARWGRALAPTLAGELTTARLASVIDMSASALKDAFPQASARAALTASLLYLAPARGYAARAQGAPWAVMKRLRFLIAMTSGRIV